MLETHPFGNFVPKKAKYLILGSFTTKEAYTDVKKYVWFYSNGGRNNFWPILSEIYGRNLQTRTDMQTLLTDLNMALADIIYQCERLKKSNLDINLKNLVINSSLAELIKVNKIQKIFFTSRFVEKLYRRHFKDLILTYPQIELLTLPSPSPRYAAMTKADKIRKYKELLPTF